MSLLQFSSNSIENAPIFTLILRVTASVYIPGHFVTHTLSHTTHYKGHSPLRRCISTCVFLNKVSFSRIVARFFLFRIALYLSCHTRTYSPQPPSGLCRSPLQADSAFEWAQQPSKLTESGLNCCWIPSSSHHLLQGSGELAGTFEEASKSLQVTSTPIPSSPSG